MRGPPSRLEADAPLADAGVAESADLAAAGRPDLAGRDLTQVGPSDCPLPQLLVAIENLQTGALRGGQIARYSLASGSPQICQSISGAGDLWAQPLAVGFIAPDSYAAATRDGLVVFDTKDNVRFTAPVPPSQVNYLPVGVFGLSSGSATAVAVASARGASAVPTVDDLYVYDATGALAHYQPGRSLPIGDTVVMMTGDPLHAGQLLALVEGGATPAAAWQVDPAQMTKTQIQPTLTLSRLTTIGAASWGGLRRIAWASEGDGVYASVDTGSPSLLTGPFTCDGCHPIDAVPDPSSATQLFLLCDDPDFAKRRVAVLDTMDHGACTDVVDGSFFGPDTRMARLAAAEP